MKTQLIAALLLITTTFFAWGDQHLTAAEVRKIDVEAKKITLKHAPIKSLDMPAMTMVFQIKDSALIQQITSMQVGDKIMFAAQQLQGAFIITQIEKNDTK